MPKKGKQEKGKWMGVNAPETSIARSTVLRGGNPDTELRDCMCEISCLSCDLSKLTGIFGLSRDLLRMYSVYGCTV